MDKTNRNTITIKMNGDIYKKLNKRIIEEINRRGKLLTISGYIKELIIEDLKNGKS